MNTNTKPKVKASTRREGNYYLRYNNKSKSGNTYYKYRSYKALVLPRQPFSLGLWDKLISLFGAKA